jgi:hypothetical protein
LHSKVTSGSFEWNVKTASGSHVSAFGFTSMNASGGSPAGNGSYVHVNFAGVESKSPAPFMSMARTSKVWTPGARPRSSAGYSQSSHANGSLLSTRHSNTSSVMGVMSSLPM